ncbi:MAG: sigma-E processing peptidase SpoIIGA [Eubacterium sp.]|nr:sigma-E processing peptidase SpoIIGA [Eubacterium sp.]
MTVIYVDVLFIVNFFITFFLLLVTAKLSKRSEKIWRLVAASFIGGTYSLIILIDDLSFALSFIGKLAAAFIMILVAFKFKGIKAYIKETAIFFFVNFLFVGIIVGLWLIFKPKGIVINNSTVYFNVSAKLLLITALVAYIISAIIIRIYNNKTAVKELYSVTVFKNGNEVRFFAFADSGNNLKEPFSNYPVIVADKKLFENCECQRLIPFSTIGGEGVLSAFRPDKVEISSSFGSVAVEEVYIAISDNVKKGEYQGILNPKILNV